MLMFCGDIEWKPEIKKKSIKQATKTPVNSDISKSAISRSIKETRPKNPVFGGCIFLKFFILKVKSRLKMCHKNQSICLGELLIRYLKSCKITLKL